MFTQQTKPKVKLYVILSFALAVISFILAFNSPSQAEKPATFWVKNLNDSGPESLRQALNDANDKAGKDFIKFLVSGTIFLETPLSVGAPSGVVIDGFTAPPPGITLSGFGLMVTSSNNVIRGLTIISSEGGMGIALFGNSSESNVERNLIEGNRITGFGSGVGFKLASKNVIRDNVLVGNKCGVWFHSDFPNNENVFEDNVIGDSNFSAIRLSRGFGNVIRGNYIGLDRMGNPLPNGTPFEPPFQGIQGGGIEIGGDPNSPVPITGNITVGPGNVIAFNIGPGIVIYDPSTVTGITFTRNSIFDNPGGGISLGLNSLPPPTILTTNPITGTAPPSSTVEIFFDGGDQGRFFIGSVKANQSGTFTSAYTLNDVQGNITATATDQDGNTSMFSQPVSVQ